MNLPGTDYMRRHAARICHKYIFDNSKLQINISHTVKGEILKNMANPGKNLFKRAQGEIFKLLEQDALPKFIKGPEYSAMLKCMEATNVKTDADYGNSGQLSILQRAMTRMLSGKLES